MKEQERNYTPIGVFMAFVFVGLLWLIIGVFIGRSVESKRSKPKTEIIENEEKATYYVDKVKIYGHEYFGVVRYGSHGFTVIHNPDCPCKSQKK